MGPAEEVVKVCVIVARIVLKEDDVPMEDMDIIWVVVVVGVSLYGMVVKKLVDEGVEIR